MSLSETLLPEFDQEMSTTRRVLERVPSDRLSWQPHEKSMTLGRLATHVAEMPAWADTLLRKDSFDIAPISPGGSGYKPQTLGSTGEILELFDRNIAAAREMLAATDDATFHQTWSMMRGGETMFSRPKIGVVRTMLINHIIHHRGQLTVYLRLNDVPVPSVYGPTADEAI